MSKQIDGSISIYESVEFIKRQKYVMPAFQREFVWETKQIEKLWDSILNGYPIATFLFWKIDEGNVTPDTFFNNFLTSVTFNAAGKPSQNKYDLSGIDLEITDTAVLDGQQRLTSLFLSLAGQVFRRTGRGANFLSPNLLLDLVEPTPNEDENIFRAKPLRIYFTDHIMAHNPSKFEVRDIMAEEYHNGTSRERAIQERVRKLPIKDQAYACEVLDRLCRKVHDEHLIRFIRVENLCFDEALEMFIRFNSGGKALAKADITMAMLEAHWCNARSRFSMMCNGEYSSFGNDFVIRTALMLYGDVSKSIITEGVVSSLRNEWSNFEQTLYRLKSTLAKFNVDVRQFSKSWNVLLPIIFLIHYNPNACDDNIAGIKCYLYRAVLFTYFRNGTTSKLQILKSAIIDNNYVLDSTELDQISDLKISDDKISDVLQAKKGSRVAKYALSFLSNEREPLQGNFDQDHLHPRNLFERVVPLGVDATDWVKWRKDSDTLPNLCLMPYTLNRAKNNDSLYDYVSSLTYEEKNAFFEQAMIPKNVSLQLKDFGVFFNERKQLLCQKLKFLLQ